MHPEKEAKKNPWQKQYSKYSTIFGKETYLPIDFEKQIKPQRKVTELRGLQGIMTNLPHEYDHENFTNDLFGDDVVNFE